MKSFTIVKETLGDNFILEKPAANQLSGRIN